VKACLIYLLVVCAIFDAALLATFLLNGEWTLAVMAFALVWLAFFAGVLCERFRRLL
jgi:positive regulator of sigma E activity